MIQGSAFIESKIIRDHIREGVHSEHIYKGCIYGELTVPEFLCLIQQQRFRQEPFQRFFFPYYNYSKNLFYPHTYSISTFVKYVPRYENLDI